MNWETPFAVLLWISVGVTLTAIAIGACVVAILVICDWIEAKKRRKRQGRR